MSMTSTACKYLAAMTTLRSRCLLAPSRSSLFLWSSSTWSSYTFRQIGGVPRNSKNVAEELEQDGKIATEDFEEIPKNFRKHLFRSLEKLPKKVIGKMPAIEEYIVNEWLIQYPLGARARKLQRDIAFRMKRKDRPGKLNYEDFLPIVGKLWKKGALRVGPAGKGEVIKIMPPDPEAEPQADTKNNE